MKKDLVIELFQGIFVHVSVVRMICGDDKCDEILKRIKKTDLTSYFIPYFWDPSVTLFLHRVHRGDYYHHDEHIVSIESTFDDDQVITDVRCPRLLDCPVIMKVERDERTQWEEFSRRPSTNTSKNPKENASHLVSSEPKHSSWFSALFVRHTFVDENEEGGGSEGPVGYSMATVLIYSFADMKFVILTANRFRFIRVENMYGIKSDGLRSLPFYSDMISNLRALEQDCEHDNNTAKTSKDSGNLRNACFRGEVCTITRNDAVEERYPYNVPVLFAPLLATLSPRQRVLYVQLMVGRKHHIRFEALWVSDIRVNRNTKYEENAKKERTWSSLLSSNLVGDVEFVLNNRCASSLSSKKRAYDQVDDWRGLQSPFENITTKDFNGVVKKCRSTYAIEKSIEALKSQRSGQDCLDSLYRDVRAIHQELKNWGMDNTWADPFIHDNRLVIDYEEEDMLSMSYILEK